MLKLFRKQQTPTARPTSGVEQMFRHWAREETRNRIAVNPKDGSVLVHVPEGEFEMGDGQDSDCPKHTVHLSAYWIGVYGVTNAQYLKFVQATGHRPPDNNKHREARYADHPVTDVSWDDAVAYAKWAGCQLPTEAQWEKAARGPSGLIYPWGKDWEPAKCRNDTNKGNETTAPVYAYPAGVSGYGTYNQSGNVWEWCADWYDGGYYAKSPKRDPAGPAGGSGRVLRGGSWGNGNPVDFRGAYFRGAIRRGDVPDYRSDSQGFRLVRIAS